MFDKRYIIFPLLMILAMVLSAQEPLQLKVGTYENPPKIYTNESGGVSGFWADLTRYLASQENWKIEWIHGSWQECLNRLEKNEIDMMVDVAYNEERAQRFEFQDKTILLSWEVLYVHQSSSFQSLFDLRGKKVAGLRGSINLSEPGGLKYLADKFDISCKWVEKKDYREVFEALDKKEVFAGVTNKYFGEKHETEFAVERTPFIFQPVKLHYAFPKNSKIAPNLIKSIDERIIKLRRNDNSVYYNFIDKNLGASDKITVFPKWLIILLAAILFMAVFFLVFVFILRHKVKQQTKKLRQNLEKREQAEEELKKYKKHLEEMVKERTSKLEQTQKQLIGRQRLATLGEFAGSLSHEIRNPLAVIDSSVVNLQLQNYTDEHLAKHLNRIREAVKKSERVINSLRRLIQNGQPVLRELEINNIIRNMKDISEIPPNINLNLNLSEQEIFIKGDEMQLKICFDNLIRNALDALEDGGEIEIDTTLKENDKCIIIIKDTGKGIAPEEFDKIFEPLYSTKAFGIGFGLSLVKQIVESHKGELNIDSEPGKWTKVTIIFPITERKD
ncbi:MAG: transporter substrate-binding domain-containing protein [Candidatus Cloacimonetes bacterium]|nr:transporter substrate-binding domain-containing protein [Candidatus Cloacimonadota bacterium]